MESERSEVDKAAEARTKTQEAMQCFRETLLYDHKHYYKDLSILNAVVFVLCILVFLGQENYP